MVPPTTFLLCPTIHNEMSSRVTLGSVSSSRADDTNKTSATSHYIAANDPYTNLSLVQVQVVFRHGSRTPLNIHSELPEVLYPATLMDRLEETVFPHQVVDYFSKEPVKKKSPDGVGTVSKLGGGSDVGTLTTVGQKDTFDLGKQLWDDYHQELGLTSYSSSTIKIRSSHIQRTVTSLCCVLAGMFGADHLASVGPVIIPVKHPEKEDIYPNILSCPMLYNDYNLVWHDIESYPPFVKDMEEIEDALGAKRNINFLSLHDYLAARVAHGNGYLSELLPFQSMIDQNSARILHSLTTCKRIVETEDSRDLTMLTMGTFFYSILDEMLVAAASEKSSKIVKVACKQPPKLVLYSAHDSTLAVLFHVLGIWKDEWPDFASNVCLELYRDPQSEDFYVRTRLCGQVVFSRGSVPGEALPLSVFESQMFPFIMTPREHDKRCSALEPKREKKCPFPLCRKIHRFFCCCFKKRPTDGDKKARNSLTKHKNDDDISADGCTHKMKDRFLTALHLQG